MVLKKTVKFSLNKIISTCSHALYSSDRVKLVYNIYGTGKPVLFFIHCWCGDRKFWNWQVKYFSKQYTCITFDLAGHGKSGKNRRTWSIDSFADDVINLITHLKLEKIIIVAHSIGGIIALETAKKIPEKLIGIISIDGFNNNDSKLSNDEINEFLVPYQRDFKTTMSDYASPHFTPKTDPVTTKKIINKLVTTDKSIAISVLKQYLLYDKISSLQNLIHPLICLNSDRLPTDGKKLKALNKKIEITILEDTGHFMMVDSYEKFNSFLERSIIKMKLLS